MVCAFAKRACMTVACLRHTRENDAKRRAVKHALMPGRHSRCMEALSAPCIARPGDQACNQGKPMNPTSLPFIAFHPGRQPKARGAPIQDPDQEPGKPSEPFQPAPEPVVPPSEPVTPEPEPLSEPPEPLVPTPEPLAGRCRACRPLIAAPLEVPDTVAE